MKRPFYYFSATVQAKTRKKVIEELEFFLEQLQEEADGGGTDDPVKGIESNWGIIKQ